MASAAAISAVFSALRVFWSLFLCKAAKITAASSVRAKTIPYLLLYLGAGERFVMGVLMCSQGLVNTAGDKQLNYCLSGTFHPSSGERVDISRQLFMEKWGE